MLSRSLQLARANVIKTISSQNTALRAVQFASNFSFAQNRSIHTNFLLRRQASTLTNQPQRLFSSSSSDSSDDESGPKIPPNLEDYIFYEERGVDEKAFNNPKRDAIFQRSITDREGFFGELGEEIHWHKKYSKVIDMSDKYFHKWYPDGELSIVYNAIDKHVDEGRGDDIAFYEYSAYTGREDKWTYKRMQEETGKMASIMKNQFGVKKGDTVIVYMPMVMESIVVIMAAARIGAVHAVVFGGFAPKELAIRIDNCKPALIATASCGIEPKGKIPYLPLVEESLTHTKQVENPQDIPRLVYQRPEHDGKYEDRSMEDHPKHFDYDTLMAAETEIHPCVPVGSNDPLYILYTSGTTGAPKGIQRDTGGTAVALKYSMEKIWDCRRGDVQFSTSDIGWIVGHSFIIWGPPLNNVPSVFFDGKPNYPNAGIVWELCKKFGVTSIFSSPTAMRVLKKDDYDGNYFKKWGPTAAVKGISFAGERLDPDTVRWLRRNMPYTAVNDTWWQTETGWPIGGDILNQKYRGPIFPTLPGSVNKPNVGYDIKIFDDENNEVPPGTLGKVVVKLPMPPQFMTTIWGNDDAFIEKYLAETPGYYTSGDAGVMDEYGYLSIMTRVDDVINTAAHRISTGRLEEVVNDHPDCVESAVVGYNDPLKGEMPLAFVSLRGEMDITKMTEEEKDELKKQLNAAVRKDVGAFASLIGVVLCEKLPKTRSGKILRKTIRHIAEKKEYAFPATIDDPSALDYIEQQVRLWEENRAKK